MPVECFLSFADQHPCLVLFFCACAAFAVGDGVKLGRAIGARLMHMDQVQVHPTGFVEPGDPTNRVKFLGPEALRGAGGIMVNDKVGAFVWYLGLLVVAGLWKRASMSRCSW